MSILMEQLKKSYSAQSIERKDITLKDLVNKEGELDANNSQTIELEITGLASKLVPKYRNEDNEGYHTMIYLSDGRKTGAFSNALFSFAKFFYSTIGMDTTSDFNKIEFGKDKSIKVKVSVVPLDGNRSTYNFDILDGNIDSTSDVEKIAGAETLLIKG